MRNETILKWVLPVVFLGAGVAGVVALRSLTTVADQEEVTVPPTSVEVVTLTPVTKAASVTARGTVQASARVDLVAQVSGKVVEVASGLTPGRRFRKGDTIARIDPRDYENNVVLAEANLQTARVELQLEQGRGTQARREWELLGAEGSSPLALREPQAAAAQARVASAEASLATASLALERTRLVAPFDAIVVSESLDVGQVVAPGAPVAVLMGTEKFRVRVSVPVQDLRLLDLAEAGETGPRAVVRQRLGDGTELSVEGYAVRTLGELDAETRSAGLIVAIDHPFEVPAGTQPILPGAYVEVTIEGREEAEVYAVPRLALVDGSAVWVAEADDTLGRREVTLAWSVSDVAYVRTGLQPGDRVVVSAMSLPVVGMPLAVTASVAENR